MPGFMKKTAVYLGLMEGDDPYAYEDYTEEADEEPRTVHQDERDDADDGERYAAPGARETPVEHDPRPSLFLSEPRRPQGAARDTGPDRRDSGDYARPAPLSMLPERVDRYERPAHVATPMGSVAHGFGGGGGGGTTTSEAYRITTLHPHSYNDARAIGEHFRTGTPVIMNLTEMDDTDAKRLVDFAAGLTFGLHGRIERVTAKVFLLSPHNVQVTAQDKARIESGFFNQS